MAVRKKATKAPAKKKTPAKKKLTKKKAPAKKKSADMKTKPTAASVDKFLAGVANEARRADAMTALAIMKRITGLQPKMWGPSIVGFGAYHYKYASGREGDMCMTGFSPRSTGLVFYVIGGVAKDDPLYARLGKHKMSVSCLYINKLADIDLEVLEAIIRKSFAYMKKTYPTTA